MTEKEARALEPEGLEALAWDTPCFVFLPGRYYLAMVYFEIPRAIRPGNFTGMFWRFEDKPEEWIFTWRFRWYVDTKIHGSKDEKSWYASRLNPQKCSTAEPDVEARAREAIQALADCWPGIKPDWFFIRGGVESLFALREAGKLPEWLHTAEETWSGTE